MKQTLTLNVYGSRDDLCLPDPLAEAQKSRLFHPPKPKSSKSPANATSIFPNPPPRRPCIHASMHPSSHPPILTSSHSLILPSSHPPHPSRHFEPHPTCFAKPIIIQHSPSFPSPANRQAVRLNFSTDLALECWAIHCGCGGVSDENLGCLSRGGAKDAQQGCQYVTCRQLTCNKGLFRLLVVVVIGSGPAAHTAAVYLGRAELKRELVAGCWLLFSPCPQN